MGTYINNYINNFTSSMGTGSLSSNPFSGMSKSAAACEKALQIICPASVNCDWWVNEHYAPIAYYSVTGTSNIYQFISKFQGFNNESVNQRAGITIYKDRDNCMMTYTNTSNQVLSEYIVGNLGAGSSYTKTLPQAIKINPVIFKTIYSQSSGQFEHYTSQDEGISWSFNKVETKAIIGAQRFGLFTKTFSSFDYDVFANFSYMTVDVSGSSGWSRVYSNEFTSSNHGLSTDLGSGIITSSGETICFECSKRRSADLWRLIYNAPRYFTKITYPTSKVFYKTKLIFISSSDNSGDTNSTGMFLSDTEVPYSSDNFYLFDINNKNYTLAVSRIDTGGAQGGIVSTTVQNPNLFPLHFGIELTSGSSSASASFKYSYDGESWNTIYSASTTSNFTNFKSIGLFAKTYATGGINYVPRFISKYDYLSQDKYDEYIEGGSSIYRYSITGNFPNHFIVTSKLHKQINSQLANKTFEYVNVYGDSVNIFFSSSLDASGKAILDSIVGGHDGIPYSEPGTQLNEFLTLDGKRPMFGNLQMGNNTITGVGTLNEVNVEQHALLHNSATQNNIDADRLVIDYVPTSYVRDQSTLEAGDIKDLSAHLSGIDSAVSLSNNNLSSILFGKSFLNKEQQAIRTTTSQVFQNALFCEYACEMAGKYRIGWTYDWSYDSSTDDIEIRILLDGNINLLSVLHREEPTDSLGTGPAGTDQIHENTGFKYIDLAGGYHTISIEFRSTVSGINAAIHNSSVEIWRVN